MEECEKGGFKLLARQMMDAVGKRYAVHEIVWRNASEGEGTDRRFVTAKFRFVPLSFFESTTGELRFLGTQSLTEGMPLKPGAWMVTLGEGLMIASATAWMLKNISLNDWLRSCERRGTPALIGVSASPEGSAGWESLKQILADVQDGKAAVQSQSDNIRVLDLLAGGNLPYPELIERIDRLLAALWRGADLSTLSRDRGYGASLQEKETCALEEDDAEMITETLNRYVDAWVIRHVFGETVKPLARVKVLVSPRECTSNDLEVDEFLLRHGAPLSMEATLNRYGRALPKSDEKVFLTQFDRLKASLPENSQNPGPAEHIGNADERAVLDATHPWRGLNVSSRGCLPDGERERTTRGSVSGLANRFALLQEEWLQLSPYGDYPHSRGIQRVDRAAAEGMVARFNSLSGRAGRLFGGLPFYAGHPDMPGASELADRKAYGWIMELAAREDGFYGRVKWSNAGLELLRNAHFKFLSPFWEAREIGMENGRKVYRPVTLISAGLTNQPNIPVNPLVNETAAGKDEPRSTTLHCESIVGALGARRPELLTFHHRRDRIRETVLHKMQLGLSYDEAWENTKREHGVWFEQQ